MRAPRSEPTRAGPRGFTLVEILIVVIILGILAAVIVPQFSNASQDSRRASLTSQLQTLRSQLNLYSTQHLDQYPPGLVSGGADAWAEMTVKTNTDHSTTGTPQHGPYLIAAPVNTLNGHSAVEVVSADLGRGGVPNPAAATVGWLFNPATGKVWATTTLGTYVFNEANVNDPNNVNK